MHFFFFSKQKKRPKNMLCFWTDHDVFLVFYKLWGSAVVSEQSSVPMSEKRKWLRQEIQVSSRPLSIQATASPIFVALQQGMRKPRDGLPVQHKLVPRQDAIADGLLLSARRREMLVVGVAYKTPETRRDRSKTTT